MLLPFSMSKYTTGITWFINIYKRIKRGDGVLLSEPTGGPLVSVPCLWSLIKLSVWAASRLLKHFIKTIGWHNSSIDAVILPFCDDWWVLGNYAVTSFWEEVIYCLFPLVVITSLHRMVPEREKNLALLFLLPWLEELLPVVSQINLTIY